MCRPVQHNATVRYDVCRPVQHNAAVRYDVCRPVQHTMPRSGTMCVGLSNTATVRYDVFRPVQQCRGQVRCVQACPTQCHVRYDVSRPVQQCHGQVRCVQACPTHNATFNCVWNNMKILFLTFIVAPCIIESIYCSLTNKCTFYQTWRSLNLHENTHSYRSYMFGLRPSSGILYRA